MVDFESRVFESEMLLEYGRHLSSYAPCTTSTSGRSAPFSYFHLWLPLHRSLWIGTRGVMEILGLDPYQSQTQYLEGFLRDFPERIQSGYLSPLCIFSVSTQWEKSAKEWIHSGDKADTCSTFILPIINKPLRIRCQASHFSRV